MNQPSTHRSDTHIIVILDRSGSMKSNTRATIRAVNDFVDDQKKQPGDAQLSLVLFSGSVSVPCQRVLLAAAPVLTTASYRPDGSTALLDAVGSTIEDVRRASSTEPGGERVLVLIVTDGMENASTRYSRGQVQSLIAEAQERHGWEFVYLGANQDAFTEGTKLGVRSGRMRDFSASAKGIGDLMRATSRATSRYRGEDELQVRSEGRVFFRPEDDAAQIAASPALDWARPYALPEVSGKKVLLIGAGGGSDILMAATLGEDFASRGAAEIVLANVKRGLVGEPAEQVLPGIFRLTGPVPRAEELRNAQGTAAIDRLLPKGARGCPFVILDPRQDPAREHQLVQSLKDLAPDLIVVVDLGGDVLVPRRTPGRLRRDQRTIQFARRTGIDLLLFVVGLGCDGDFEEQQLRVAATAQAAHYLGRFPLEPLLGRLDQLSRPLARPNPGDTSWKLYTPRILVETAQGTMKADARGFVTLERTAGRKRIPRDWLLSGFAFDGGVMS